METRTRACSLCGGSVMQRYCEMCDTWFQARHVECPACGATTVRAERETDPGLPQCPRCGSEAWIYQGDRLVCADCGK